MTRAAGHPKTVDVEIGISATLAVPHGCTVAHAPTGIPVGIRLPDGRVVKPFIAYEISASDDEDPTEITEDGLMELEIHVVMDHERTIDGID